LCIVKVFNYFGVAQVLSKEGEVSKSNLNENETSPDQTDVSLPQDPHQVSYWSF